MKTRTAALLFIGAILPVSLWGQGQACTKYHTWNLSGNAGCGGPDSSWIAGVAGWQEAYGGSGPNCTYTDTGLYNTSCNADTFAGVWAGGPGF